ncbi:unnamed protein product [Heterobilharzia americana]|nr:unnamed protein product [Heterobilharzia americana]
MMLEEMINFNCDEFKVDDLEIDHEDKILKQELNQLISEQLGDFDLSDEEDQPEEIRMVHCSSDFAEGETVPINPDDVVSILETEKLSLLEGAIQRFGECSENATTGSKDLTSPVCDGLDSCNRHKLSKSSGQYNKDPQIIQRPDNSSSESDRYENRTNDHSVSETTMCGSIQHSCLPSFVDCLSQNKASTKAPGTHPSINWDLSLPGEVEDGLYKVAQNENMCMTQGCHTISGHKNCIQASISPWSFIPDASLGYQESVSCSRNPKASTSLHAVYNDMIQASISVDTKSHLVSETAVKAASQTTELTPCITSSITYSGNQDLDSHLLAELQMEVIELKEAIAKEKRLSNHRALLAEGEKETLRSKLSTLEDTVRSLRQELVKKQESSEVLQKQLQQNDESQKKLGEELSALRSANESLSSQLVELTTGNALKRAEEREAQLAQSFEQRFVSKTEEIKAELKTTRKNLNEKEIEVTNLRRQTNKQLEEAQKHCQQLASSALCSEITEDVNKILQDELRDFREQVGIYENVLKLDMYCHNSGDNIDPAINDPSDCTPYAIKGRHTGKSVAFANVDVVENKHNNSVHQRPSSATERPIHHNFDDNFSIFDAWNSDEQSRQYRVQDSGSKQVRSDNDELVDRSGDCKQSLFQSLTRQGILTSTPAVAITSPKSPMARLRAELERCLLNYKAKREQITRLHEVLYTTRCQLHQSREATEKAEKSAKLYR